MRHLNKEQHFLTSLHRTLANPVSTLLILLFNLCTHSFCGCCLSFYLLLRKDIPITQLLDKHNYTQINNANPLSSSSSALTSGFTMHSWALLVSFLLLSCVHLEQERNFILFPLSCQASINSLHGSILLTFLKLGTCKSACWSSTAAGGAIQEQTCKLKQQAEATWHCPYHSL